MAFLIPDKTEVICGLTIKTKLIPITAKMNKATGRHKKGDPFRDQRKLNGTGRPSMLTIHNTGAINQAKGTTMSEQYSRATYPNQNMGTVRPHYFVDDVEAWHIVPETDVSWHAGEKANVCSLSIEIIGAQSEDNGAKLAAILMNKYKFPISKMTTHNYWMGLPNKIVYGASKNCPYYILPHWEQFVAKVERYMKEFSGETPDCITHTVIKGDTPWALAVKYLGDGTRYPEIMALNGLAKDAPLIVGQVLKIPSKDAQPEPKPPTPEPDPTPKLVDAWARKNTLKRGSKGKHVEVLQAMLAARNYTVTIIDGDFGAQTDKAVRAYQTHNRLVVDGVVGAQTWLPLLNGR